MRANVYLCGPPGAGKSTVAPLLAALRGMEAVDVDAAIESETGRRIAQIVEADGEPAFRAHERDAIAALARREDAVVALGAGALEDEENRRAIAAGGTLVFLDASVATCEERTAAAAGTRPLLREPGALARLHAARQAKYLTAHVRVPVDGTAPDDVARAVDDALRARDETPPTLDEILADAGTPPDAGMPPNDARDLRVVHVSTAKPYDVVIGERAFDELPQRVQPSAGGRVVVVVDEGVLPLGERVAGAYEAAGFAVTILPVRADESLKSLDALGTLYASFVDARLDRRGLVVGVGGGTIGDAVGFATATFQRGVPFVAVPTTLLAAVDAAIGGKTAINLPGGKNLVGTVTQPALVAIAPHALRTLPRRDVVSGYGEMLKYGLALDAGLYRALRAGESALLDDPATALDAIARCVELKADVVTRDEDDRTGTRAVLNFGHTVGHAIEKVAGYGALRHGEAVIVGMRAALALSAACGILDETVRADADAHLATLPVPRLWRELDADALIEATRGDKKRGAGGTRYVLLDAIGSARLHDGVRSEDVRAALAAIGLGARDPSPTGMPYEQHRHDPA